MGKFTKTQRFREKMRAAAKQPRQKTLDFQPEARHEEPAKAVAPERKKRIVITEIGTVTKEDELDLRVVFRLLPSKAAFSKITAELYFDEQRLHAVCISIPQGPLARDDFEFYPVFNMTGISAGSHAIRVEIYELGGSGEKLTCTSKEATIEYVPVRREDRLIKIPIVKSVVGAGVVAVSDSEKDIYRELGESMKRESASKRDEW